MSLKIKNLTKKKVDSAFNKAIKMSPLIVAK